MSVQIKKQLLRDQQLMDQYGSNEIMLNAISALENLAFFYQFPGPRIFDYYSGYAQTENELINAVLIQLEIFRYSYLNYSSIYTNYDFPKNLTKEQIILFIKEWKKYIPSHKKNNIEIYFDEIIRYLEGNPISGISKIIDKKRMEWGPTTRQDLERFGRFSPFANSQIFNQMYNIKEIYNRTGNYEINAKLNQTKEANKFMQDLYQNDQIYKKKQEEFKDIITKINRYFETFCKTIINKSINVKSKLINKTDSDSIKKHLDSFKSLLPMICLEEAASREIIDKFLDYKNIITTFPKDNEDIKFLKKICDDIMNCVQKKSMNINLDKDEDMPDDMK